MHGLFARCHAGDVILYLWSRSRFTYLSAVLGEACLVEVGQGIRLLRGEPTPRLLCEERSLKAAAWCRIFILLPQSRLLSSLFYSVNIPLFLFLFFFFLHPQRPFFFLCGDSGFSESLGWKTADAENFWDYYYHQIHDKTKSTTWNCFT